jgi:flagellar hook protein FlgE
VLATAQDGFQKTDVQFFDTLGNAGTFSVTYMRSGRANQWDVDIVPPSGTAVMTLYDSTPLTPLVYDSKGLLEFTDRPSDGATITIDGTTYEFDTNAAVTGTNTAVNIATATTLSDDVARLLTAIQTTDSDFAAAYERVTLSPNSPTALLFHENGTDAISVNPVGLLDVDGNPVTKQTEAFNVMKQNAAYSDNTQITFAANPAVGNTIVINGYTYTFVAGASVGQNVSQAVDLATTLASLEAAIEATDPQMSGNRVRIRENDDSGAVDTLVLSSLPSGSYTVTGTGLAVTEPDGTALNLVTGTTVDTLYGLHFDVDGLPETVNVGSIEILGFASGAADMNGALGDSPRIAMDFGTLGEADGMTQFGASFTPVFIQQNGSRFGTFAGVTISPEGLVTALFDNGETRNIFKVPIATFVNPNALEARTGNIWNATEASGDYTLRVADSGPAGAVTQGALEASTVDIGEEFTKMIVVQRAYSASTKIIRTADEMLDELTRIK